MQYFVGRSVKLHIVLHDSYETVSRDGSIDLNLDCIFRCTPEFFDSKVLLEPFEEQFNLPSVFVQIGNLKLLRNSTICAKTNLSLCICCPLNLAAKLQFQIVAHEFLLQQTNFQSFQRTFSDF